MAYLRTPRHRRSASLAIALAYALTGAFALMVSVAPHYVSLVFAPAGLALAAAMVFGARVAWLPILAGSAVVQWLAGIQSGLGPLGWNLILTPVGATLQAIAGAWLARLLVGPASPLDSSRSVARFLLIVAPLSCTIGASLSVPGLVASGLVAPADAWATWGQWWLGDTLGVMLAAPIALVFIGRPARMWRPRRLFVALPLLMTAMLVVLMFNQSVSSEHFRLEAQFERDSESVAQLISKRLEAQRDMIVALGSFATLVRDLERDDFQTFVAPMLARHAGIQNFTWNPRVIAAQREAFEARLQAEGVGRSEIADRDPADPRATVVAGAAAEYLPIHFVEPLEGNRAVVGYNPISGPAAAAAIEAARRSGEPAASAAFTLLQERGEQRGVVLYQAVFESSDPSAPTRPTELRGVVSSAFRMDDALAGTLRGGSPRGVELCLIDLDAPPTNRRLSGVEGCELEAWRHGQLFVTHPLGFAGRSWEIRLRAGPDYAPAHRGQEKWIAALVGLFATAVLAALVLTTSGQSRRITRLVEQRTADLEATTRSLRAQQAAIEQLAHYDALTGLPNRNLWAVRSGAAIQSAQRHGDALAVLFLDLDQFKTVNDSLGHAIGDQLLCTVSRRLAACVRGEDVLARLGGDEFAVLLPRLTCREDAATVARKMLCALADPVEVDLHELSPSVSIGIALYPADGCDLDTLVKHADTAMYSAKTAGRNNFQFFVPDMNARALERLTLEAGLRRALDRDEFILHYQPQIDTELERLVGCEALVRWHHPELGLVMPDRFIPIAEDSGLISRIGDWVLRSAMRRQVEWRKSGHAELLVAINISALQFNRSEFIDSVRAALQDTGADPRCIELEITESALLRPSDELFARLQELREIGLTLALDDFGTGYSSLAYLKRMPISRLKLDRSFVKDLPGDAEDAAIASAAISMARDLGIEVVAEGVETPAQRDFLAARGCRIMQGYLFGRPVEAASLTETLVATTA